MALPAMTEEVADAIMDWIDSDTEARDYGAEDGYYTSLEPPYTAKKWTVGVIEKAFIGRGVTPELLFGLDDNHNGIWTILRVLPRASMAIWNRIWHSDGQIT